MRDFVIGCGSGSMRFNLAKTAAAVVRAPTLTDYATAIIQNEAARVQLYNCFT
jgi:hypothetical protein